MPTQDQHSCLEVTSNAIQKKIYVPLFLHSETL